MAKKTTKKKTAGGSKAKVRKTTKKSAPPVKSAGKSKAKARASKATKRTARSPSKPAAPRERASAASTATKARVTDRAARRGKPTTKEATRLAVIAPAETPPAATARAAKPLAPSEVEEFRQMLLQKRAEILRDMETLQGEALNSNRQEAAGDLSTMPIHMADLGSDNYELEFTLGLIEGERTILREIEEALERVRGGTYGFCLATGNPIGKARLRAKPWAKYCYEYTLAQEQGRAHGI